MSPTLLLTALAGITTGWAFHRFRIPGGALVGSLLGAGMLHAFVDGLAPMPRDVRVIAQIAVGTIVGATLRREPLQRLASAMPKILGIVLFVLLSAAGAAVALLFVTPFDLTTLLLATVPGGAADVTAAALDLNGNAAIVAAFQLIRQMTVFIVVGTLFQRVTGRPAQAPDE